jgi:PAS domain S-box-containing protein
MMKSLNPLRRIQGNFSIKVFFSLICAMTVLAAVFNYFYIRTQTRNYDRQIVDNGIILAQFTANAARLGIFAGDIELIREIFVPILATKGVVEVCAVDSEKRLLLSQKVTPDLSPSSCATSNTVKGKEAISRVLHSSAPVCLENAGLLEFWAPAWTKGMTYDSETLFFEESNAKAKQPREAVGYVIVTMDKKLLMEGLQEIIRTNIFMLLTALLIGSLITFFIVRTATKPLKKLTARVKRQGQPTTGTDELGLLANTFDNMLQQIDDSFTTIQSLQAGLEKKVQELQQEIEDHARTGKALERSERKYRTLVETIRDIVYTLDTEARITYTSPVVEQLTGYSPRELLGKKFLDYVSPVFKESALEQFSRSFEQGINISYEAEFIKKDGTPIFLEVNGSALLDADGNVIGRIGSARDVTKRKQMEKYRQELEVKALHQSKMAALGQIAAGVAHEVNQPLSYIKIIYESTLNDIELNQLDHDELKADFREALRQVNRITQIINHLRTFGRDDQKMFQEIDLRRVLDNTLILMANKIRRSGITFIKDLAEAPPPVTGNFVNLEQVFINLIQNSIAGLEGRKDGEITFSIKPEADKVIIRCGDNGPGIPYEIQERIFEPFFTTREVGLGSGLGLSIVFGIIEEHNGTIALESTPGRGATFIISLPAAQESGADEKD